MADPAEGFVHLDVVSSFSFRRACSAPETLVTRAAALGYRALALTDWHGPYGAVRFVQAARAAGIRPIVGATVEVEPGGRLVLLVEDAGGWTNLCRLLTAAHLAGAKERPYLTASTLALHAVGLTALVGPDSLVAARLLADDGVGAGVALEELRGYFGVGHLWLELVNHHAEVDRVRDRLLVDLGHGAGVGVVATNMVHYADPEDGPTLDVLTCARQHLSLPESGVARPASHEAYLKSRAEMARLYAWCPTALINAGRVADGCQFAFDALASRLPRFVTPPGETSYSFLTKLVNHGAEERYGAVTPAVTRQLAHELGVIEALGWSDYFLVVWDVCREARERGILVQGRGSAANSAVAYCLRITNVDPIGLGLLFERFLSADRIEAPDIDVDIANDRRDEVITYFHDRWGRDRTATVAEYICWRGPSAARDLGRALGLSEDRLAALARDLADEDNGNDGDEGVDAPADDDEAAPVPWPWSLPAGHPPGDAVNLPSGPAFDARGRLRDLLARLHDQPRHLGMHSGGMLLTGRPLVELLPIERARKDGRVVTCWDKDDVAALGLIKIDLLGLGMLSLLGRCVRLLKETRGLEVDLARLTPDDPAVFDLLQQADTVGVFQVESGAQMSLAPRLRATCFYDLVISVALIRPGPVIGQAVHPYLRRRAGVEPVSYPHPSLAPALEKTLGVTLFQEQGLRVAMIAAGFSAGEADQLRRAMGAKRSAAAMAALEGRFFQGTAERGIDRPTADTIWRQLSAFAQYGFAESHAASFALLVYQSAYLKRYFPVEYAASLINCQPMGFYAIDTIVSDLRRHGVAIRPPDVQASRYDWTVERGPDGVLALRVGLRAVARIGPAHAGQLDAATADGPYRDLDDFRRRTGIAGEALANLAAANAFAGLGLERRRALWLAASPPPPAGALPDLIPPEAEPDLPPMTPDEGLLQDYRIMGCSPIGHLMLLHRQEATRLGARPLVDLAALPDGAWARLAGLATVVQSPPTAHGVRFITLEDETAMVRVVLHPVQAMRSRGVLEATTLLVVEGTVQRADGTVSLLVQSVMPLAESDGRRMHAGRHRPPTRGAPA